MKKLFYITTMVLLAAPAGYALADGPEDAKPSKHKALDDEKAQALAADLALTDYSPDPLLSSDRRIKMLMYDEGDVYTITTKYGYQTNIVFGNGESIETISVGDRSMWQIIPSANRMFIRPMEENVTTNMTVLTNKHSYQFDLKSVSAEKQGGNIYVARFTYPEDERAKPVPMPRPVMTSVAPPPPPPAVVEPPAPVVVETPVPVHTEVLPPPASASPVVSDSSPDMGTSGRPNYNYTYTGPDELAPLQVYDDGISTFIKYRTPHPPFPKIFAVTVGGKEEPLSYMVKSDMMVVDTIKDKLALKSDQGTITVYNEMLNPM